MVPFDPSAAASEHWTAKYRRRLGIGGSVVQLCPPFGIWHPPNQGEFKINYSITMPDFDPKTGDYAYEFAGFGAAARDSKGDIFGYAMGGKKFASKLGMQLYALRAAANLAKELKEKEIHDGPVVYESNCVLLTVILSKTTTGFVGGEGDTEEVLGDEMPEDLEGVDERCEIRVGNPEEVMLGCPGLRVLVEKDKRNAGTSQLLTNCMCWRRWICITVE